MPQIPKTQKERWNQKDIAKLKKLLSMGKTVAEIAVELQRTEQSVQSGIQAIRILSSNSSKRWKWLREWITTGTRSTGPKGEISFLGKIASPPTIHELLTEGTRSTGAKVRMKNLPLAHEPKTGVLRGKLFLARRGK